MVFLSTFSLAKSSFHVASRFISTTFINFNQQVKTPNTKELEDLFFSNNDTKSTDVNLSSNEQQNRKKFSIGFFLF